MEHIFNVYLLCPHLGGIKRWCCLTSVAYIQSAGGMCGRPTGWRVLADRARLGRPGSRLPLRAFVAGLGGGISWRPPAYSLFLIINTNACRINVQDQDQDSELQDGDRDQEFSVLVWLWSSYPKRDVDHTCGTVFLPVWNFLDFLFRVFGPK